LPNKHFEKYKIAEWFFAESAVHNKVKKFYTIVFIVITILQFITRFPALFSEAVTVYKVAGIETPAVTRKLIFLYIQVNHTNRKSLTNHGSF